MGTAVGIIGSLAGTALQSKAQGEAAQTASDAAQSNVQFLETAGRFGAQDIEDSLQAGLAAGQFRESASAPLQRFADVGAGAFQQARGDILSGRVGGGISDAIAAGGVRATDLFNVSPMARRAVQRRSRLMGESTSPGVAQQLMGIGGTGLGATTDIANIGVRQAELEGNLRQRAGAQKATALIGQGPAIGEQIQTGQEARLIGQLGQQQSLATGAENIAALLGRG